MKRFRRPRRGAIDRNLWLCQRVARETELGSCSAPSLGARPILPCPLCLYSLSLSLFFSLSRSLFLAHTHKVFLRRDVGWRRAVQNLGRSSNGTSGADTERKRGPAEYQVKTRVGYMSLRVCVCVCVREKKRDRTREREKGTNKYQQNERKI